MVTSEQLRESKDVQRRTGRTFHVATRFLPERARDPTYVLYAFFRMADDVVDDPDPGVPADLRAELDRMCAAATGERPSDDPVLTAFDEMRERHAIPDREVETFLDAMETDVEPEGYDTFDDLSEYLRGSAVAVAYMMLDVMDSADADADADAAAARPHARALGEAFQLTNFLRDVREDVTEYGRIYLPRETLAEHGVSTDEITDLQFSDGVAAAVRAELRRTEERYREGVAGIQYLPKDCRFPVLLSAVLYAEYHRIIRERGYDVLSATPSLGSVDYVRETTRTWWHWRTAPDAETAFYRASAVPASPEKVPRTDADAPPTAGRDDPSDRFHGGMLRRPLGRVADALRARWPVG